MNIKGREKEICTQLDLQQPYHQGGVIAIIEGKGGHGNYILSSVVDHCLKHNWGVCLVCLLNPATHYHGMGVKFGHDLRQAHARRQVEVIDLLAQFRDLILFSEADMLEGEELVKWLLDKIKGSVQELLTKYEQAFVLIDDLSVLFSVGVDAKLAQGFVHYLQLLVASPSINRPEGKCSLMVLTHCESSNNNAVRLAAALRHCAVATVTVTESRQTVDFSQV